MANTIEYTKEGFLNIIRSPKIFKKRKGDILHLFQSQSLEQKEIIQSAAQELIKACLEIFLNQEESDISKMSSMLIIKDVMDLGVHSVLSAVSQKLLNYLGSIIVKHKDEVPLGKNFFSSNPTEEQQQIGSNIVVRMQECIFSWACWFYRNSNASFIRVMEQCMRNGVIFPEEDKFINFSQDDLYKFQGENGYQAVLYIEDLVNMTFSINDTISFFIAYFSSKDQKKQEQQQEKQEQQQIVDEESIQDCIQVYQELINENISKDLNIFFFEDKIQYEIILEYVNQALPIIMKFSQNNLISELQTSLIPLILKYQNSIKEAQSNSLNKKLPLNLKQDAPQQQLLSDVPNDIQHPLNFHQQKQQINTKQKVIEDKQKGEDRDLKEQQYNIIINELKQNLKQSQENESRLSTQFNSLQLQENQKKKELEEKIRQIQRELNEKIVNEQNLLKLESHNPQQQSLLELQQQYQQQQREIEEYESKLERKEIVIEEHKKEINENQREKEELRRQLKSLNEEFQKQKQTIDQMKVNEEQQDSQIELQKTQIYTYNYQIESQQQNISALQLKLSELKQEKEELYYQQKINKQHNNYQDESVQSDPIEILPKNNNQLDELMKQLEGKNNEIEQLQQQLDEMSKENIKNESLIKKTQTQLQDYIKHFQQAQSQLITLDKAYQDQQHQISHQLEQQEDYQRKIECKEETISQLSKQIEQFQNNNNTDISSTYPLEQQSKIIPALNEESPKIISKNSYRQSRSLSLQDNDIMNVNNKISIQNENFVQQQNDEYEKVKRELKCIAEDQLLFNNQLNKLGIQNQSSSTPNSYKYKTFSTTAFDFFTPQISKSSNTKVLNTAPHFYPKTTRHQQHLNQYITLSQLQNLQKQSTQNRITSSPVKSIVIRGNSEEKKKGVSDRISIMSFRLNNVNDESIKYEESFQNEEELIFYQKDYFSQFNRNHMFSNQILSLFKESSFKCKSILFDNGILQINQISHNIIFDGENKKVYLDDKNKHFILELNLKNISRYPIQQFSLSYRNFEKQLSNILSSNSTKFILFFMIFQCF